MKCLFSQEVIHHSSHNIHEYLSMIFLWMLIRIQIYYYQVQQPKNKIIINHQFKNSTYSRFGDFFIRFACFLSFFRFFFFTFCFWFRGITLSLSWLLWFFGWLFFLWFFWFFNLLLLLFRLCFWSLKIILLAIRIILNNSKTYRFRRWITR